MGLDKDTVNAALREALERERRAAALARLAAEAEAGAFDVLLRKENYRKAVAAAGEPVARVRRSEQGSLRGQIHIADDFDELPDDIAKVFGVDNPAPDPDCDEATTGIGRLV